MCWAWGRFGARPSEAMSGRDPDGPLQEQEDLREARVDRERSILYSEGVSANPPEFFINGKELNHDRVDQTMLLGDVEE